MAKRQSLVSLGVKHSARVGSARIVRDMIPGNGLIQTILRTAILAGIYYYISRHRTYVPVDDEIIEAELV